MGNRDSLEQFFTISTYTLSSLLNNPDKEQLFKDAKILEKEGLLYTAPPKL